MEIDLLQARHLDSQTESGVDGNVVTCARTNAQRCGAGLGRRSAIEGAGMLVMLAWHLQTAPTPLADIKQRSGRD